LSSQEEMIAITTITPSSPTNRKVRTSSKISIEVCDNSTLNNQDQDQDDAAQLGSTKMIKVKTLKAIVSGYEHFDEIRKETHAHLKNLYASESIEFIYEVQQLKSMNDSKKRHHAINYVMREFILPDSPKEVCFPGFQVTNVKQL
jgi:hypothetical protein